MKKLLIISLLFLIGCDESIPMGGYKSQMINSKYKIGNTIIVDKGFYAGCSLKIEKIEPLYYETLYLGKSECPIKGFTSRGIVR